MQRFSEVCKMNKNKRTTQVYNGPERSAKIQPVNLHRSQNETKGEPRQFRTLRLSITGHCNLSCVYCKPDKHSALAELSHNGFTPASVLLERLRPLVQDGPIRKVRLTGGEPLLYPQAELVKLIRGISGMNAGVWLTTNGILLAPRIQALADAGLRGANISLDALEPAVFRRIAKGGNPGRVVSSIDAALETGIEVKINATVMRGLNESQIIPLLEFALQRKALLRYIELMKMGPLKNMHEQYFFSREEILTMISQAGLPEALERKTGATANYWRVGLNGGASGVFGIISSHSDSFCADCDRLRMDEKGRLYGCLSSEQFVEWGTEGLAARERDLNAASSLDGSPLDMQRKTKDVLAEAMEHKSERFTESSLEMIRIGG